MSGRSRYVALWIAFLLGGPIVGGVCGIILPLAAQFVENFLHPSNPAPLAMMLMVTPLLGAVFGLFAGPLAAKRFLKEPPTPPGFDVTRKGAKPRQ